MKYKKGLVLVFFLIMLAVLSAQDDYVLKKIHFTGNQTISTGRLKRKLSLKAKNIGHTILFWKQAPTFNEFFLEEDIKQIIVEYQKEGFLHVEVSAHKDFQARKKEAEITFQIQENQPVLVHSIEYDLVSDTEDEKVRLLELLRGNESAIPLQQDERFRDSEVQAARTQIFRLLQKNGYPFPEIDFDIRLRKNNSLTVVIYEIETGSYCDFGEISIIGNEKTPAKPIMKQVTFEKEEMFSQTEIERTQRFVQQLGMFQIVTVRNRLADIHDNKIPIDIIVHELPYWSLKTGVGYGLEDKFRVSLNLQKLGFLGGVRRANFYAKHSYLEPYHFSLKVTQPSFLNRQSSLTITPFLKKEHEIAYDLQRYGIVFTLQQGLSPTINTFANYKFERNNLEEKDSDTSELTSEFYNKSSVSWGIYRDTSAPPFFPEKGLYTSLVTTLSGLKLGSKYHYLQGLLDVRKYQSITNDLVLAGRGKIGAMKPIWGDDTTPIEERFYAGGSNSIRGWARGEVGPHNENDVPTGGTKYIEFSLELRQRLYRIFYLVAFADFGNVWQNEYELEDLLYAGGLGIRIQTPIGPIRFDAAQPVWHSRKRIQLHISIGQAF